MKITKEVQIHLDVGPRKYYNLWLSGIWERRTPSSLIRSERTEFEIELKSIQVSNFSRHHIVQKSKKHSFALIQHVLETFSRYNISHWSFAC